MDRFILDGRYQDLLTAHHLDVESALRKANLPGDSFKKEHPTMSEKGYYDFMAAVGDQLDDSFVPIEIATTDQIETFSPPLFAAYCSRNGKIFINRLAKYKKLIGPLSFKIHENNTSISITLSISDDHQYNIPNFVVLGEFAFLLGVLRKATKVSINPQKIEMKNPDDNPKIIDFFNLAAVKGEENTITFSKKDLELNFISYNQAIWNYFKPELTKRLSELEVDDSISARVRSALAELLASGEFTIDDVAKKLGYSKRTLQRKLSNENTSFQKQLNSTREMLAINYLKNPNMTTNDIAYLLGYQELNSFLRAFTIWTGMSLSEYQKKHNINN